jgi:hypothetical protein
MTELETFLEHWPTVHAVIRSDIQVGEGAESIHALAELYRRHNRGFDKPLKGQGATAFALIEARNKPHKLAPLREEHESIP